MFILYESEETHKYLNLIQTAISDTGGHIVQDVIDELAGLAGHSHARTLGLDESLQGLSGRYFNYCYCCCNF